MSCTRLTCGIALVFALASVTLLPAAAQEEEQMDTGISIYVEPIEPSDLPLPGQPLTLSAQLINSKDVTLPMRALVSIDGKLMDIPVTDAELNKFDYPEYLLKVHSPRSEITYQFILSEDEESVLFSDRYSVRRECVIEEVTVDPEVATDLKRQERLDTLVQVAKGLKREINAYNEAKRLLDELQKHVMEK